MINYLNFIPAGLLLWIIAIGCTNNDVVLEVPEHIQELGNLTVYPADSKPTETITFQKEVVFGETDDILLGRMGEVAVDSLGRVYIADIGKMVIYAFEPDGQFIDRVGRDGSGPGEFSSYIKNLQIHGNRLYAFDPAPSRLNIFALDNLSVEKTISLGQNRSNFQALTTVFPHIRNLFVTGGDNFIAEFVTHSTKDSHKFQNVDLTSLYYSLDYGGDISEKILEFTSEIRTNLMLIINLKDFFGHVLHGFSSHGRIILAEPDHFLVKTYSPSGDYQSAFFYPIRQIPITRESVDEAGVPDRIKISGKEISLMETVDLPESWPVLTDMRIDDHDRLWIATTVKNKSIYEWWVLKDTGELITRFEWPRNEPIEVVKNGYIYTRETEEETGLQKVIRYRMEMK